MVEDTEWCQVWLATLGVPQLGRGHSLGAGSMLWLEFGHVVAEEISGSQLKPEGIVARARSLWAEQP